MYITRIFYCFNNRKIRIRQDKEIRKLNLDIEIGEFLLTTKKLPHIFSTVSIIFAALSFWLSYNEYRHRASENKEQSEILKQKLDSTKREILKVVEQRLQLKPALDTAKVN